MKYIDVRMLYMIFRNSCNKRHTRYSVNILPLRGEGGGGLDGGSRGVPVGEFPLHSPFSNSVKVSTCMSRLHTELPLIVLWVPLPINGTCITRTLESLPNPINTML